MADQGSVSVEVKIASPRGTDPVQHQRNVAAARDAASEVTPQIKVTTGGIQKR